MDANACIGSGRSGRAKTLRKKREFLLNWFRADGALSSGVVEGFNNKVKLITRKSYGFRAQEAYETALYHNLGTLPEPEFTHRFVERGLFFTLQLTVFHGEAVREAFDSREYSRLR